MRVWGFLALLVRTGAAILDLATHRAKPPIGFDRQDNEVAADIVANDQMPSTRVHGQMCRNRATDRLAVYQRHHTAGRVDCICLGRAEFLSLIVVDLVDDI